MQTDDLFETCREIGGFTVERTLQECEDTQTKAVAATGILFGVICSTFELMNATDDEIAEVMLQISQSVGEMMARRTEMN